MGAPAVRRFRPALALLAAGLLAIGGASCSVFSRARRGPSLERIESAVFVRVNSYRRSLRLPALVLDGQLRALARERSREMARTNGLSHTRLEARIESLRRPYRAAAENAEFNGGFNDPAAAAVEHWISSPEHRRIMEGDFDRTGIGVARSRNGSYYFSQIFFKGR